MRIYLCASLVATNVLWGMTAALAESKQSSEAQPLRSARPVTPNQFEGSDSERINQAISAAAKSGRPVAIPRVNHSSNGIREIWSLDSAILIQSGTVLKLVNCHLKLSDRCRDNFIRSANCGLGITDIEPIENIHIRGVGRVVLEGADRPRASGGANKTLGKRTYGSDAGKPGVSQTGDWRNIGILLAYVNGFSIENIHIADSHGWAISLERCASGDIRNVSFNSSGYKMIDGKREVMLNQDGVDLRQGCHDIVIDNLHGETGDDLLALTNLPNEEQKAGSASSMMVTRANNRGEGSDDIRDVIIRNVRGFSHGDHIVRFLNNDGLRLHDVILDGLIDTSNDERIKAAVKIGDNRYGGRAPLGDTYRLIINNVVSRAEHTILIDGTLSDSMITNVIRYGDGGEPITYEAGKDQVRNLVVTNVESFTTPDRSPANPTNPRLE